MNIYEITGELLKLQEMAENGEFGENPETDQCFNDTLESVMYDFENKIDDYGHVLRNLEAQAKALKEEKDRLYKKEQSIKNSVKRIKERILMCLEASDQKKVKGAVFSMSVAAGRDKLPDEIPFEVVPPEFVKIPDPVIDRSGLLDAVKAGKVKDIPLVKGKSSLRIS